MVHRHGVVCVPTMIFMYNIRVQYSCIIFINNNHIPITIFPATVMYTVPLCNQEMANSKNIVLHDRTPNLILISGYLHFQLKFSYRESVAVTVILCLATVCIQEWKEAAPRLKEFSQKGIRTRQYHSAMSAYISVTIKATFSMITCFMALIGKL